MSVLDQVTNIKVMPDEELTDQMSRRMIVGKNQMLTVWNMKKGAHSSAHDHPEEQIFLILSGKIEFEIDGQRRRCIGPYRCDSRQRYARSMGDRGCRDGEPVFARAHGLSDPRRARLHEGVGIRKK